MTSPDPRTPVIVGVHQHSYRDGDNEPIAMMAEMADAALADSGADLRPHIQSVRAIKGIWPYVDPGRLVVDRLGLDGVETAVTQIGGNEVYDAVNRTCEDIAAGRLDAAVVCAAEALRTRRRDHGAGKTTQYLPERDGAAADVEYGKPGGGRPTDQERNVGIGTAVAFYAAVETAMRHRRGESPETHRRRIAELWARASQVAATNPDAWIPEAKTADEIASASDANRMVNSPYPKLMTSNIDVDQAAAVVICSAEVAAQAGVPRDRWVFPLAGTGAADAEVMSCRRHLDQSPAMSTAGNRALQLAGLGIDDIGLIDLYSCFPSAVQLAQEVLGLDPARPFTLTGGLTFSGGPLNSYCMHALVRAVDLIRESDEDTAFVSGNGGYFSKHSFMVLADSPRQPYVNERVDVSEQLDERPLAGSVPQQGTIETYTVAYERTGSPHAAVIAVIDDTDARTWVRSSDEATIGALLSDDLVGATVKVTDGEVPTGVLVAG